MSLLLKIGNQPPPRWTTGCPAGQGKLKIRRYGFNFSKNNQRIASEI